MLHGFCSRTKVEAVLELTTKAHFWVSLDQPNREMSAANFLQMEKSDLLRIYRLKGLGRWDARNLEGRSVDKQFTIGHNPFASTFKTA